MNLADSDFLFYHSPHPGTRISFTDTYLYFSAGLPGSPSARIPIIKSISSFYAWKSPSFEDVYLPIFRIEIQKMIEINLTSIGMVSSSLKKYILNFSDLNSIINITNIENNIIPNDFICEPKRDCNILL